MRAFVLQGNRAGLDTSRPRPEASKDRVRVRMRAAGVCNTDLELIRGYMGFSGVLGHEFVGTALDGRFAGRRVVGGINFGCGRCRRCNDGLARHCEDRTVLGIQGTDGVFAEEFLIPDENLVPVPDAVDDRSATFAEPVAAAHEIVDQLGAEAPREDAVVLGDGKLGPLIAQVLAADGFNVTLVGHHLDSLGWLLDRGVNLSDRAPEQASCGLVVEATGSAHGLREAIAATRPRGTLVLKTTVADAHEIDLSPIVIHEIQVLGSRCGRMAPALELLAAGSVTVEPLISAVYSLDEVETAFEHATRRGTRKILVENS
jgi:threonine dehydrogenase-like Zn-dependent dehydrogenase